MRYSRGSNSAWSGRFWNLLRTGLGYGLVLHTSVALSKSAMCAICTYYLKYIRPASFWILYGFVTVFLLLLNFLVIRVVYNIFFSNTKPEDRPFSLIYNSIPKTTRSGAVYGYM